MSGRGAGTGTGADDATYLVAGSRPWNRDLFEREIARLPGDWRFVGRRDELTAEAVAGVDPRYLFFLHWSWKVPQEIVERYECVAFHMTDLPYGRGGSPLQNLILRGHTSTRLTAFRMVAELDAGPVYGKEDLSLEGTAREIYERAGELSARMVARIVRERPEPRPQQGEVVVFRRRRPEESRIPEGATIETLYDFVRMLDCDGYPRAFLHRGGLRYEFRGAKLRDGGLDVEVRVTGNGEDTNG